jgi:MoaA/NifB/PqqE/SkfB family radical SAM enzyme
MKTDIPLIAIGEPAPAHMVRESQRSSRVKIGARTIHGYQKSIIHLRLRITLLGVLISCYRNPADWIRGLRYLIRLRKKVLGNHRLRKMVRVGPLYYMGLYSPGWNDATYRKFIASELMHFKPHSLPTYRFNQVFLAVTKKCPLQCDHCYAWDTLNQKDTMDVRKFRSILADLVRVGTMQLYLTGGEPLVKFDMLLQMLSCLPPEMKSWVSTSGFQLTPEKAMRLKNVGLTGVFISLDHYLPEKHNAFRKYPEAYSWALRAVRNALEAGLVVTFSICLSDEMCQKDSLIKYMDLAREMGVHFVQFFEPKAVGHYRDKHVELSAKSVRIAEETFLEFNFGKYHQDYPIISYHGYYKRRIGCFGGGSRGIHVDADGNLNACPFCQKGYGNVFEGNFDAGIAAMSNEGCPGARS